MGFVVVSSGECSYHLASQGLLKPKGKQKEHNVLGTAVGVDATKLSIFHPPQARLLATRIALRLIYPHEEELFVFITCNKILILSVTGSSPSLSMKSFIPPPGTGSCWEWGKWRAGERCITQERERSSNSRRLRSLIFPWRSPGVQFPVITLTSPQWELLLKRRRAWLMSGRQSLSKWGS